MVEWSTDQELLFLNAIRDYRAGKLDNYFRCVPRDYASPLFWTKFGEVVDERASAANIETISIRDMILRGNKLESSYIKERNVS